MPFQAEAENNSCSNRNTYKNEMKVIDKKSVQVC